MNASRRWLLSLAAVSLFASFVPDAHAQTAPPPTRATPCNPATPPDALCVTMTGDLPTKFTNGNAIDRPLVYRVEQRFGTGEWVTKAQNLSTPQAYITGLAPGLYSYRWVVGCTGCTDSAPNAEASGTASAPPPPQPSVPGGTRVVQVIIGIDYAPVYTVLGDGSRSATVGGLVPVGTECEGQVLFKYRGKEWRKPLSFKPWYTSAAARVAAPCA